MSLVKGICQMPSLLSLVEDIRHRKSASIEHIGDSLKKKDADPNSISR